jgi:transcription initiation factor IIE alpha subunit
MKKLIIVLILATCTGTAFAQTGKEKMSNSKMDTSAKYIYTCTMHPEVITDKPGKCPKCGMDLVKKKVDKIYTCTMHPEVISDKPGKCPKCGMDLIEKKSSTKMKS